MEKYYDILMQFTDGNKVSKLHLLNTGNKSHKKYTDEDIRILEEELRFIRAVGVNAYGEPVYIITEAGKQYRDN